MSYYCPVFLFLGLVCSPCGSLTPSCHLNPNKFRFKPCQCRYDNNVVKMSSGRVDTLVLAENDDTRAAFRLQTKMDCRDPVGGSQCLFSQHSPKLTFSQSKGALKKNRSLNLKEEGV